MKPTKIYSFSLPANGTFSLLVMGDYFKIMSASGLVEVRGDTFGTIGSILPGQGVRDTPFNRLEFRDMTGVVNAMSILVADEAFVDDRITGEVSVIDGGRIRTMAQAVFLAYGVRAPAAGQMPVVQLWNPVASGRRLVVSQVVSNNFMTGARIAHISWGTTAGASVLLTTPQNKLLGGVASVAQMRYQDVAAAIGNLMCDVYMPPSLGVTFKMTEPVIVLPGYGLQVDSGVDSTISVQFEYYEESIL